MKWLIPIFVLVISSLRAEETKVSFSTELAPILQTKCLGCHSDTKAKGGYRAHTFSATRTAGKSGQPAITPGQPEASELLQRLVTTDPDDRMPQDDEPLSPAQVDLFRRWIAEAATLDTGSPEAPLNALIPAAAHPSPPVDYPRPLPVLALAFDPGGQSIAVNGYHEINLWNLDGELQRRITNAPARIRSLAFHPTGGYLAAAGGLPGRSGEFGIYRLSDGQLETNLVRAADEMLCAAFSADGKWPAVGGANNAIHVFDWEKRLEITTIQQHADWVTALAFSADGQQIASASRDRTARVYHARNGELETTYTGHNSPLSAVAFISPELIVSGGRDRSLHFWKIEDGKRRNEIGGFEAGTLQILVSGDQLYTASSDGLVRQYATGDRKQIRTLPKHGDAVFALAIHPAGQRLASGSYDGEVKIWNTADGSLLQKFYAAPGWKNVAN